MKAPEDVPRSELLEAVAPLLQLLDVDQADVVSLNVAPKSVSVRVRGRGPRGRLLHGVVIRRTHRIVAELED